MKIIVADKISERGLALLRETGWEVLTPTAAALPSELANAGGLVVRSATKATAELLEKAPRLRVIGRAGVGVDNVDVEAATRRGILVMNTPGGNAVSVAEHTLALMLGLARAVPQANASIQAGRWEKSAFSGTELRGKTLGLVGLGRVGTEVARRARALEMKVLAYDPFVTPAAAREVEVELVPLDDVLRQSDVVSLHTSLSAVTEKMLDAAAIAKMKKGARLVNCARGELIDEAALAEALKSGHLAGAALDTFAQEPPKNSPLIGLPNLIATPHIAGSTAEAQEEVGTAIAQQVRDYLSDGLIRNAVNMPALSPDQYRALSPYMALAERLGNFAAYIANGNPRIVRLTYFGRIADGNTNLLRNAGVAGALSRSTSKKANLVNAMTIAEHRGWTVQEGREPRSGHTDSIRLDLITDSGVTTVEGAVLLGKPRLMQVDGIQCEMALAGSLIYMNNLDVPGVIGHVGTVLGRNQINIANFSLGRRDKPTVPGQPLDAVALVSTDGLVPESVLAQLRDHSGVKFARAVEFE